MEPPVDGGLGGILGLRRWLAEETNHRAITVDLIRLGRSIHALGSPQLSWYELKCLIQYAPAGSEVAKLVDPISDFHKTDVMVATWIADALHAANWQRSGGGRQFPKRVLDAVKHSVTLAREAEQDTMTLAKANDIRARLARRHTAKRRDTQQ